MQINTFPQQQKFCARKLSSFDVFMRDRIYAKAVSEMACVHTQDDAKLATALRRGDPNARETLIKGTLRYVLYNVNNLLGSYEHPLANDLISAGNMALVNAVDKAAKQKRGPKRLLEILYASVNYAVKEALPEDIKVRFPNYIWGKKPADILPVDIKTGPRTLRRIRNTPLSKPLSLSMPVGRRKTLADVITDGLTGNPLTAAEQKDMQHALNNALGRLNERQIEVLRLRFVQGCTYEETASILEISRARVGQIEKKALRILSHPARREKLEGHLEVNQTKSRFR